MIGLKGRTGNIIRIGFAACALGVAAQTIAQPQCGAIIDEKMRNGLERAGFAIGIQIASDLETLDKKIVETLSKGGTIWTTLSGGNKEERTQAYNEGRRTGRERSKELEGKNTQIEREIVEAANDAHKIASEIMSWALCQGTIDECDTAGHCKEMDIAIKQEAI